ncbi:hypothetical protein [Halalkalicoccus salilacus]|uniref:hypothetical protein n=1 Tax=Halalkalicoccus TaxID=332246 RepID=UPI002F964ACC
MSILLPTTRWTDACGGLAAQLGDHDELLIIHDVEDDPHHRTTNHLRERPTHRCR